MKHTPDFPANPHVRLDNTGTSGYRVYAHKRLIGVVAPIVDGWRYSTRDRFPRNVNGHSKTLADAVGSICTRNDVPWVKG